MELNPSLFLCEGEGTVERKIAWTNLQRPVTNQILTLKAVEQFFNENILGVTFFFIYKKDMVQVLDATYLLGDTVIDTRSCHHFEPSSTTSIKGNQLSDEHVYTIKHHSFSVLSTASDIKIALTLKLNDYATCIFDDFW